MNELTLLELVLAFAGVGLALVGLLWKIGDGFVKRWAVQLEETTGQWASRLDKINTNMETGFHGIERKIERHEDRIHKLHIEVEGRVSRVEEQMRWWQAVQAGQSNGNKRDES